MVGYYYDANYIYSTLVKNYKGFIIKYVWKELLKIFIKVGVTPKIFILDNEISKELIEIFENELTIYQLVTLFKYKNNQAERAM